MAILYVAQQGSSVKLVGGRIEVRSENRILQELPSGKLEQIVAFGFVRLSYGVTAFCLKQGIDVAFLSTNGKYLGRLQPEMHKNVMLRQKQYERAQSADFCLSVAKTIVAGKIRNMIAMIRRQRRLRTDGLSPVTELEALLSRIGGARALESLLGFEGTATAAYFRTWRAALKGEWGFEKRRHHPPGDPVNALLSLGYTLLYNDMYAALNTTGLDPYLGYFHRPRYGHAALASDLMEEHRSVVVDRLVLTALNRRVITEGDFLIQEGALRLTPKALKQYLALYGEEISSGVYYPEKGAKTTYRQLLEWQARHLARVITGEEAVYKSYDAEATSVIY